MAFEMANECIALNKKKKKYENSNPNIKIYRRSTIEPGRQALSSLRSTKQYRKHRQWCSNTINK